MNTYKKVLPLAVAMALAACGGGSDTVPDQSGGASFDTHARFNPVTSDLPLNTDLVFAAAATSDGTADVGAPSNPVEAGINALDGFSTNAPFDIYFTGGELDEASIKVCQQAMLATGECAQSNVFVLALDTGDEDALDPSNVNQAAPFLFPLADVSASVISRDGEQNNVLRITPNKPFDAATKYLVFVTNGLKDTDGNSVGASAAYDALGESEPPVSGALASVRGAIQNWEALAAGFIGEASGGLIPSEVAKDSVVISYTFTTTDPVTPLVGMAAPTAALFQAQKDLGMDDMTAITNIGSILQAESMGVVTLSKPKARDVGLPVMVNLGAGDQDVGVDLSVFTGQNAGVGKLYTGFIKLPYYLSTPDTTSSASYTMDPWKADTVLGAVLGSALPEGSPALPPQDVDGSYNVTYRYPFAQQRSEESVPLQVTVPGAACDASSPYKTAIYVHGNRSDRSAVVALAHSLASECVATVSIDQPLHGVTNSTANPLYALNVENMSASGLGTLFSTLYGEDAPHERHFNDPGGAGAQFVNLVNLPNTRDNLRQSVMDVLNLNASLEVISTELTDQGLGGLDLDNVNVIGTSLGSMVATVATTTNQLAIGADGQLAAAASNPALASNLNSVKSLTVSAGGGQLTQILNNSLSLAPEIHGGLAAAGVNVGTSDFEKFLYVAQSTIDSGDPVNFASTLADLGVPVLMQQIVGGAELSDGQTYTADKVVPNAPAGYPLAGTTGLAVLLETTQLGASGSLSGNALINMTAGHHSSLLRPNEQASQAPVQGELLATGEMQTQVVSFIASGAAAVSVGTASGGAGAAVVENPAP